MPSEKRQRQRESRQKRLEAERKAARRRALRRRFIQVAVLFVIVVAVLGVNSLLGGEDEPSAAGSTTTSLALPTTTTEAVPIPQTYADYRARPVACGGTLPDPVQEMTFAAPEDQGLNNDDQVVATVVTSCGDIVLELDPEAAPETVNSFVFLARQGYFDGSAFHRIVEGFMVQGGDPLAQGTGDPGYSLPDEFPAEGFSYSKGTLAMANSGPGTSGSQFFIMLDDGGLPAQFSVFGRAVDSDATLEAIEALPKEFRQMGAGLELSVPMEGLFIERIDIEVTPTS